MKRSGKCPKCDSRNIAVNAKPVDRRDYNIPDKMMVATFSDPDALIFKGTKSSPVSAWVCKSCGYLELYADTPSDLA